LHDSKLIVLLSTFNARDHNRFREYLQSPFFNKREDLLDFYECLRGFAPEFDPGRCTRENVWQAYASGKPFNSKSLNYLANFLLTLAEDFLAVRGLRKDGITSGIWLMDHYLEQRLEKHYRSTLLRTKKALEAEPYRDSQWHLNAWRVEELAIQQFYASRTRKADDTIQKAQTHLDAFYLDRTFELGTEQFSINQMFQRSCNTDYVEELLEITDQQAAEHPIIRIRRLIFRIHVAPENHEVFEELLALLPAVQSHFRPDQAKGVFAYAQNHCIRRIRAGDSQYEQLLFQIYQQSIASGVIYENGHLSPWDFKNVCSIGLKLEAYDWIGDFIDNSNSKIEAPFRNSALAYNQGNWHFHQGQFDAALRSLAKVEFSDVYYALDTRRITLMIYYQRGDQEGMAFLIPAFRSYVRRIKGISDSQRFAYKNFVNWVAKLARISPAELKRDRESLMQQLAEVKPLIERVWLADRLHLD